VFNRRQVSEGSGEPQRDRPVLGVESAGSATVVRLAGEIDLYNVDQVRTAIGGAVDSGPSRVVIDLSQVEFMDSTALGVLIEARAALPEGALRLAAPQLETMRALKVSGLDRHLPVHDTVAEALSAD
jgi:anti-sigma B factor antagonist